MNLQGRNLSINLQGADVVLLQTELGQLGYQIPSLEVTGQRFGTNTQTAVQDFQRKRGLPANGVVDSVTAKAINAAVAAVMPPRFIVTGHVRHQDGTALSGVTVRAFDKDLLGEEQLAEVTTDANGFYQFNFTSESFRRAEKRTADLIVKAYSPEGLEIVTSPVIFNAQVQTTEIGRAHV